MAAHGQSLDLPMRFQGVSAVSRPSIRKGVAEAWCLPRRCGWRSLVRAFKAGCWDVGVLQAAPGMMADRGSRVILSVVHLFIRRLRPRLFRIERSMVRALKASVVGMLSAEAVSFSLS